jgi:predicted HicB family RNase H-like nuclease
MKNISTFPLRLPRSIKAAVVKVSKQDGTSINQFIATAVAEKLAVMDADLFLRLGKAVRT